MFPLIWLVRLDVNATDGWFVCVVFMKIQNQQSGYHCHCCRCSRNAINIAFDERDIFYNEIESISRGFCLFIQISIYMQNAKQFHQHQHHHLQQQRK